MPTFPLSNLSKNHLLARLPPSEYHRLLPELKPVPLRKKEILYRINGPIDYAYFPTSGILSTVVVMEDGSTIEVATIGNEGIGGLPAFFGGETSAHEIMVQVEGDGMRINAKALQREADKKGPLREILSLYHTALQTQISYSVACNGLHTVEKRCGRWLLMTHDRVESDVLPLTHQFLSTMLGVRRPGVTDALAPLQKEGLIRCGHGKITVLDRKRLEAASCECYYRIQEKFARLFGRSSLPFPKDVRTDERRHVR